MKKIVILTQYFPPEMGAPQSRLYETAIGLKKRGWDVLVVTAMPNYPSGKIFDSHKGRLFAEEELDGIQIIRYALYASNSRNALPRIYSMLSFSVSALFSLLQLRKFKPDYVLTESPPLTLGLSGLTLAKMCGARHIMNVSDLWPLSAYKLGAISKGFVYSRLEGLERFLYKRSFACTGQSRQIVEQVEAYGGKRVHLYRNGVDINRFEQVRNISTAHNGTGRLRIVYAGLLGIAQGILDICTHIDFAALGVEFHIYGDGAEKSDIEKYLANNPAKGIVLHSSVRRSKVPETIMQYDATIIPLIKPIFGAVPSKIYEAMAAGLPIIFTGGGEGADLIREHKTGWICEPGDYECISGRIKSMKNMEQQELGEIKQNCIHAATEVFDREIQIEGLHEFLLTAD